MEASIGRVGALAVALGIGSAIAGMSGVASAQPSGDNNSAGTSQNADADSTADTKDSKKSSRSGDNDVESGDEKSGDADTAETPKDAETSENTETPEDKRQRPRTKRDSDADSAPEDGSATVPTADPDTDDTTAPATATTTLFSPTATPNPVDTPKSPPASPLLWTMLGYAKRQSGDPSDRAVSSATGTGVSTLAGEVQAAATSSQIPGQAVQAPVITADGTVYQVTAGSGGTRVFVLDENAQVLATSEAIAGNFRGTAVARPDGSLIVVAATNRNTRSTIYRVDSSGAVMTLRTVVGATNSPVRVGADGALYFTTNLPDFFDPLSNVPYRSYRISPTNGVRTLAYNTSVELRPDGTAFLTSSKYGFSTLRVFGPTGVSRTIPLPYGSAPSDPIVALDGTVYVTAGVKGFFGSKTTRVYAFTGTANTVRTVDGLPGDAVAAPDGLYLETYTYSGSTDTGTGTTVVSRLTPTTIDASDVIDGRIAGFQVTPDGTIYAPIRIPSSTTTPVAVIAPDGSITTVTLPGTLRTRATRVRGAAETGAQDVGYVNYSAGGIDHVAVLNPDGTVARTIDLPPGATASDVIFGPDGTAYQLLDYYGPDAGQTTARRILALSSTTYTPIVTQTAAPGSYDVVFGPNGIGYLIAGKPNMTAVGILGFDAAGNTVVPESMFVQPIDQLDSSENHTLLTFSPDGTAYVYDYTVQATAGVYALTDSGAVKVLDVDRAGGIRATGPVFTEDGIGYITYQAPDGGTIVASFPALSEL